MTLDAAPLSFLSAPACAAAADDDDESCGGLCLSRALRLVLICTSFLRLENVVLIVWCSCRRDQSTSCAATGSRKMLK